MDTQTVLDIIKMIDNQKITFTKELESDADFRITDEGHAGAIRALDELQNHLQSYIEGQLNAHETTMGQGE